jgi:hypothetical protein
MATPTGDVPTGTVGSSGALADGLVDDGRPSSRRHLALDVWAISHLHFAFQLDGWEKVETRSYRRFVNI